ncbi:hypothetical protein TWF970_000075 [Orbilia oligospora]|uniref:Uncharacterized protein n=1 Tax=Orbilia oligospora TaxID=2813651 RepID=A0A7C8VQI9_ORBOL|nr:hypothetical protein TWF970_000075 [Orbilia oligospora]
MDPQTQLFLIALRKTLLVYVTYQQLVWASPESARSLVTLQLPSKALVRDGHKSEHQYLLTRNIVELCTNQVKFFQSTDQPRQRFAQRADSLEKKVSDLPLQKQLAFPPTYFFSPLSNLDTQVPKTTYNLDPIYPASAVPFYPTDYSEDVYTDSLEEDLSLTMPVIPFFPNFPSDGLELLGSTCQTQLPSLVPLGAAGQYIPQQYTQLPHTPQTQYTPSQYAPSLYAQSQPASPFATVQQRPMSAPQPGGHDSYNMLPSLQQPALAANSGYQLPSQPALTSPSLYMPISTSSMYQPSLVTPIVPSSTTSNYHPTSGHGHAHSLSLTSTPSTYDQKSSNPRTLPQPLSAGRVLSTLGAIPPSGLSLFGLTPEQQAFFQQRRLPPPPPPQPRVYSFENSTQTTIAETLAINKEKKANSPRSGRSVSPTSVA